MFDLPSIVLGCASTAFSFPFSLLSSRGELGSASLLGALSSPLDSCWTGDLEPVIGGGVLTMSSKL